MPTHTGEGPLLYSVRQFKCCLPESPPQTHLEVMFNQHCGLHSCVNLIHDINHHGPVTRETDVERVWTTDVHCIHVCTVQYSGCMWPPQFKLSKNKLRVQFLSCTIHTSDVQQPRVASGFSVGQYVHRTFLWPGKDFERHCYV